MKENHKNLNFNSVTNSKFKYLKYSDNLDNQTLLFFLNPESVCKSVRIICDRSIINEKLKEFNSIYKKSGENKWTDSRGGYSYHIEIKDEKWSYVVTIDQDK